MSPRMAATSPCGGAGWDMSLLQALVIHPHTLDQLPPARLITPFDIQEPVHGLLIHPQGRTHLLAFHLLEAFLETAAPGPARPRLV